MDGPKTPTQGSHLESILNTMDEIRDVLLEVGFKQPGVAYNRKKLDTAKTKELRPVAKFLETVREHVKTYKNVPMFPGVTSWSQYEWTPELKKTKEYLMRKNARESLKALWRERPELLKKHPKIKVKK